MADSFSKKENTKKKLQKQKEKNERREARKSNNNKGKSLDEMLVYVNEFGQLTTTPPSENKEEIRLEDIIIGATPIEEESPVKEGVISFLSEKGYGFITENRTQDNVFFHTNNCSHAVKKGNRVAFEKEKSVKGFSAINVQIIK